MLCSSDRASLVTTVACTIAIVVVCVFLVFLLGDPLVVFTDSVVVIFLGLIQEGRLTLTSCCLEGRMQLHQVLVDLLLLLVEDGDRLRLSLVVRD